MKNNVLKVRWLLGLLIFALALELCARLDDFLTYRAPFWGAYDDQVLFVHDQIGQWGRPGARYDKWELNSLGYRGPELRPGTIRIVCFGASETFGLYEPAGQEYPRQLERILNSRAGTNVFQVVNVAYAGETIPTATLRTPEIIDQIHPAIAVIYPSLAEYIWLPWLKTVSASTPAEASHTRNIQLSFQPRITRRFHTLLKQALPGAVQTKLREFETERDIAKNHYNVVDRIPDENVLYFQRDLSKLIAELRARGVEPVLVTHATAFGKQLSEADLALLSSWRVFYPMLKENGFLDMEQRLNDAIRQTADREGIALIDAANEMPSGRTYFADFVHFTSAGAGVMASHLADGLQVLIGTQGRQQSLEAPQPLDSLKVFQQASFSHNVQGIQ
jgi:lysophospholipase L1-like esterase